MKLYHKGQIKILDNPKVIEKWKRFGWKELEDGKEIPKPGRKKSK